MSEERITVADGKYTVINDNGNLSALRHGEPWARDLVGDNLVYWMFVRIRELEAIAQQAQAPVSPDMHGWCAYVGGMVAHWIKSEPDARERLGDDAFEAAIAGIIGRRLWAMPKRDTTPQPRPISAHQPTKEVKS